jgi:acetylornithine/succinyldiaminopimelate/putrescine aminotransferase
LEGRKYLDFSAGIAVNALGHGDEDFVAVSLILLDAGHMAIIWKLPSKEMCLC